MHFGKMPDIGGGIRHLETYTQQHIQCHCDIIFMCIDRHFAKISESFVRNVMTEDSINV